MDIYLIYTHIVCAFVSFMLLLIRGIMQLKGKNWREKKLLKILPHLSDTLLLVSGITMFSLFGKNIEMWFIIKMLSLVAYIFFAAKFFSKKATKVNPNFFSLAIIALSTTILVAYYH
ncbi:SirB2 family protein [Pasteurella dagmatis]|uniref:Invasion gene expression up-regulator, SirB n=1 Tax=Pasteurella dagmatis ATCC 43325 TaxID=667128 RepID=C9PPR6_9PAST|nr:SirB2 family protein [Pasteurella dagmatis]EEX50367.1 invasion gene expression up-regulator, SirB [Pasteurella dagmatis ATCC 43325]SNV56697.1 invasion gene expression up-regulator, SirB [Pasteurella dagmatis]